MIRIITLALGVVFSLSGWANSPLRIDLMPQALTLQYPQPVRLDKALSDIEANSQQHSIHRYPLMNQLFNLNKQSIADRKQQHVIEELNAAILRFPEQKSNLISLANLVASWKLGYRETISLDYDAVRLDAAKNPLLRGHFRFQTFVRPTTIHITGLVTSPSDATILPGYAASHYLNHTLKLSGADKSFVWIIYPNGETKQVGYAYWNDQHTALPPGSTLFIGFDDKNTILAGLEKEIVALIGWRVDIE